MINGSDSRRLTVWRSTGSRCDPVVIGHSATCQHRRRNANPQLSGVAGRSTARPLITFGAYFVGDLLGILLWAGQATLRPCLPLSLAAFFARGTSFAARLAILLLAFSNRCP